ncbi:MAG: putative DNA binding domain-containing protein [Deltaproteobacteria bacterium]|nr:putative DNA binding domain-containing protein [Deltaproteobacteria bacterium]
MTYRESEKIELKRSTAELKEAVISVSAILNKHGKGRLYFGIRNDGEVVGQEVGAQTLRDVSRAISENIEPHVYPSVEEVRLRGKNCILVTFGGRDAPYLAYGRAYIRVADEDRQLAPAELGRMFLAWGDEASRWESQLSTKGPRDVDAKALKGFVARANRAGRIGFASGSTRTALNKLGLLSGGKLLRAGEVLFCDDNPLEIQAAVFAGTDKRTFLDIKQFKGDAFGLLIKSETYLKEHLDWRVEFGGIERKEIPEIPVDALREALVNSVCHRDYRNPKGNEIAVFRDRVEIYNPGDFPAGHTPEDFLTGRERSILRNPLIAETLFKSKDIEKWGSGLKRIADECAEHRVAVKFEVIKTGFLVTFARTPVEADGGPRLTDTRKGRRGSTEKSSEKSSEKILRLIGMNPDISAKELAQQVGLTSRAVEKQIDRLKKDGRLRRVGPDKGGHWEVVG